MSSVRKNSSPPIHLHLRTSTFIYRRLITVTELYDINLCEHKKGLYDRTQGLGFFSFEFFLAS
jgi:hypothetical protein